MKIEVVKKSQIIAAVTGLMLITAGYLNFKNNDQTNQLVETGSLVDAVDMADIGDATLVSTQPSSDSNLLSEESSVDLENIDEEIVKKEDENKNVETSTVISNEYFTKSRLERDTMYSQMIESYQKILDKTTISESQRSTAQNEITKINEQKNAIMIAENLIKNKGFEDLIIFINDESINIIVKAKELKIEQVSQIQNIVIRELKTETENIHISNRE